MFFFFNMTFKLKNLKCVDDETKCLIFGYSKQVKDALATCNLFQTIPHLITSLCILYYFETDKFTFCHQQSEISLTNDGRTMQNCSTNSKYKARMFFLTGQEILETSKPLKCTWRIRIDHLNRNGWACIGVVALTEKQARFQPCRGGFSIDLLKHVINEGFLYAYLGLNDRSFKKRQDMSMKEYGEPFVTGDIIEVHLNLLKSKQQLLFVRNGKRLGIAFRNLKFGKDVYYRLKVAVGDQGGQLTLIDFKTH